MVPPAVVESTAALERIDFDSSLTTTKVAVEARVRAKTVTAGAEGRPVGRMPRARDVGAGVDPGVGPGVLDADPWCEVEALARADGWMER